MFDGPLDVLIRQIAALPGLGGRSAKRIALHLLSQKDKRLRPLLAALQEASDTIKSCSNCGNLDATDPCRICRDPARDKETICVVASVADVWAVERTNSYKGQYHILGGVLSALDGIGPEQLSIEPLLNRMRRTPPKEIVLALAATVDGQSTAHYLMDRIDTLQLSPLHISRLAHGVPVGGALEFLDDSTIATALKSRARL
ncbi:MAG: recombination protein RecR [Micavibrio aeruginosavorus]|uniref:Recombination protein RecR n=1 Tax=Micavibrio aeruginosavorus TaxID=349221 RepID=A0A2W5BUZ0_9BACT|nr:MAG: recombination protein RecR [Micavibrio aeruginosavorus]